jgi:hypothetical protein
LGARKSRAVEEAVALVIRGVCDLKTAAARLEVAPSSIYRDPAYREWAEKQKHHTTT